MDSAHRAGIRVTDVDQTQIDALLQPSLTPRLSTGGAQAQPLFLLALFSWLPKITAPTIGLVHDAYDLAGAKTAVPTTSTELVSELVAAGLLVVESGEEGTLTVPGLIRSLMRRITGPWAGEFHRSPHEAFSIAIDNSYARAKASDVPGYDEILDLVVEIEEWELLEQMWTRRSINVFDDVVNAVDAFLAVPASVITARPILALARSAARRIDSMRSRLGTEDSTRLVPFTDFDSVVVPSLHGMLSAGHDTARSVDEIVALTTAEARFHRSNRDYEAALQTIDSGRELLRNRDLEGSGPTAMMQAGLNLEHGKNLISAGRFAEALRVLQRVVQFSETYAPNSWHPMLAGYVETALANLGHGYGKEMGRNLTLARDKAQSFEMETLPGEHKWQCLDAMRSLDRLDLSAAGTALAKLRNAGTVKGLGSLPTIAESLYRVYTGRASIAAKELIDNAATRNSPMTSSSNTRYSGIVNIASFVYLAAGETKPIQDLATQLPPTHPAYHLVKARQSFVFGQREQLWSSTARVLNGADGPRLKGCAAALRSAFLHHEGQESAAVDSFGHVLDYCIIGSTLMPIAQMSKSSRSALIEATASHSAWTDLAEAFDDPSHSAADLQQRLLDLPEALRVTVERDVELSSAELSLLFAIDSQKPVPQIAREFGVVVGTLKNRLSALYKKFGVSSRAEVLEHAKRNGYLSSAEVPGGGSASSD
ncbi:helix-turn-helix transcriptional regulator [Brevibacterium oceani]|uniref:helix-turn-helix transcriptional regulator n=1 Tax=Brevibacterium oceani TaxID=358099 RepID=UPI001B33FA45|nr:response regulator transcription factor [Brevibacterium oceani]